MRNKIARLQQPVPLYARYMYVVFAFAFIISSKPAITYQFFYLFLSSPAHENRLEYLIVNQVTILVFH